MSGLQLAERLAPMRPEMKVLIMSGSANEPTLLERVVQSGFALIRKPLTPGALLRKVQEVCTRSAAAS